MDLGSSVSRIDGLPLYVHRAGGETVMKPCAEALLPDPVIEALEGAGLLPLVAHPRMDSIALPALQSIAAPRFPLRWRQ
jgi:predicted component of type VI protein secretion system